MKKDDLDEAIRLWVEDSPGFFRSTARSVMAFYYTKLPQPFRPSGLLHFATKSAVYCSAPGLAYFVYESITAWMATVASAAIVFLNSLVGLLDRFASGKKVSMQSDQTESIMRVGEILRMSAPASKAQANRDDMVRSALGVIENYTRQVTKAKKGQISVSVALYNGSSSSRMSIRHRNPGNTRPIGRQFDGRGVLGHHACESGRGPKIVHNINRMHRDLRKSPTHSEVVYRSFLLLPVMVTRNGQTRIGGFLSIDSSRPYTFYGSRGQLLVVTCEPIVEHIEKLL